ncbi:MAG: aldolase/citrate lyase family protein [Chloroflexota bacterium]|nr:aldolase/citrate lyase family protein [Chloroflexota bacterium]MDE2969906.1 aldolase/citrate lyase family protein [Chloroflexota bacterium]
MPPVRRSLLFTPANVRRFVEGVWRHGADVVVLDLEDSVAPGEKAAAREGVREAIALVGRGGSEAALRVNADAVAADCEAGVWPGLCAIVLPKAESAEQVRELDTLLSRLEAARSMAGGGVEIMPMIESAAGVRSAYEIASASARVRSFGVLGEADLTADLGIVFDDLHETDVLGYARGEVGLVARALGLTVNGRVWTPGRSTIADYGDAEALDRSMQASWEGGCRSTFCVHPAQVAAANRGLRPSESDVAMCAEAVRAYTEAHRQGLAYGVRQGVIIDAATARSALAAIGYAMECATKDAVKLLRRREMERAQEAANADSTGDAETP